METSEVWSGLDEALHELGMLCSDDNHRGHVRDKPEKYRRPNSMVTGTNSSRSHYRHLLPNQSWNRPGIRSEVEEDGVQSSYMKNTIRPSNSENTENSFSVKPCKVGKISEPKSGVSLGIAKYSVGHPDVFAENEGLNVLRMNSNYITGVTIGTFGSPRNGFNKNETNVKPGCSHNNTPKHGLSISSLRHHHLRPYEIPWRREERVRTTSETAENETGTTPIDSSDSPYNYLVVGSGRKINTEKLWGSLLKSRSLENVRIAENEVLQVPAHEMDSMSKRIQHLHVE